MKWRDHKRLAYQMAEAFGLNDYKRELVAGSVEPDTKKEVVHVWPKAKKVARAKMYRARRAFLKDNLKKCARYLGIVSHYIEDGIVHGEMDASSRDEDHSTLEGDIGARADVSNALKIDSLEEGLPDGEFVFREIDALVREGMSKERLGRALSLLGSAVLSAPSAPPEVVESRRRFVKAIKTPLVRILATAALLIGAGGAILLEDPLWLFLLPFALPWSGSPEIFRFLRSYGWLLLLGPLLGFLDEYQWLRLIPGLILAGEIIFLHTIPDPGKWSERWYRLPK